MGLYIVQAYGSPIGRLWGPHGFIVLFDESPMSPPWIPVATHVFPVGLCCVRLPSGFINKTIQ